MQPGLAITGTGFNLCEHRHRAIGSWIDVPLRTAGRERRRRTTAQPFNLIAGGPENDVPIRRNVVVDVAGRTRDDARDARLEIPAHQLLGDRVAEGRVPDRPVPCHTEGRPAVGTAEIGQDAVAPLEDPGERQRLRASDKQRAARKQEPSAHRAQCTIVELLDGPAGQVLNGHAATRVQHTRRVLVEDDAARGQPLTLHDGPRHNRVHRAKLLDALSGRAVAGDEGNLHGLPVERGKRALQVHTAHPGQQLVAVADLDDAGRRSVIGAGRCQAQGRSDRACPASAPPTCQQGRPPGHRPSR